MSSELPQNMDWTIQEERLQYGAEKKRQHDTAYLISGHPNLGRSYFWKK